MSQIKVNEIYDASGGSAAKLYGSSMRYGGTAFVNRIINGEMRIDQRNAGASAGTGSGTFAYFLDRWVASYTQNSKFTVQQNAGGVSPPSGFTNYLGMTSSSAYAVAAGDAFNMQQPIEGFNVADLGWGAAGAQSVTVSFWVRSSLTGTFGGAVCNANLTRSYPFTYTIIAANTWEQKTVNIAGDTSGTWVTNSGVGLRLYFNLGAGSTYSGTAGAWAGSNFQSATGATSVVGTNGATFYITGVQLEAGTVATPFERRDYGRELMMCQRYYLKESQSNFYATYLLSAAARNTYYSYVTLSATMRANPTVSISYDNMHKPGIRFDAITSSTAIASSPRTFMAQFIVATNDDCYVGQVTGFAYAASAEL